jgi:hypothetical protein
MNKKRKSAFLFVVLLCFLLSGCAVLKLPFDVLNLVGKTVGRVLGIVKDMPKPPPGVFGGF